MDSQNLALLASFAAVILSVVATVTTWSYQRGETDRSVRKQLTDVMNKLVDADNRQIELYAKRHNEEEFDAIVGELTQLRYLLAGQAAFLMDQITFSKVASVEYNELAGVYANLANFPQAIKYYELSVHRARDEDRFTHAVSARSCAQLLFSLKQLDAGRKYFEKARQSTTGHDDYDLSWTVDTLVPWAQHEVAFAGDTRKAEDLYKEAHLVTQRIRNQAIRRLLPAALPPLASIQSPTNQNASRFLDATPSQAIDPTGIQSNP